MTSYAKIGFRPRHLWLGAAFLFLLTVLAACSPLPGEGWANYTVSGQYVYVSYKETIFRIDLKAQPNPASEIAPDWGAITPNKTHIYAAPGLSAKGDLYVGAFDRKMWMFSPFGGGNRAERNAGFDAPTETDKFIGGALVNDALGLVYAPMGDKGLKAYDLTTGKLVASYTDMKFGVWSTPVFDQATNVVYIAAKDHSVYALDPKTLTKVWSVDVEASMTSTPLLANGKLYVGTLGNGLAVVDLRSRSFTTFKPAEIGWISATPVLDDGILYFGDLRGQIWAVEADTLARKWVTKEPESKNLPITGKVALAVSNHPDALVEGQPGRVVIAASESKQIHAYRVDTGAHVWGQQAEEKINSDLFIFGDDVIFTTLSDNQLLTGYNVNTAQRSFTVKKPSEDYLKGLANGPAPKQAELIAATPDAAQTPEGTAQPASATAEATAAATASK